MVFYHYITRLGLGIAFTITAPILTSTSLACYLICKLSFFVYQQPMHHRLLKSDEKGCWDLHVPLNHKKLCNRYHILFVCKSPCLQPQLIRNIDIHFKCLVMSKSCVAETRKYPYGVHTAMLIMITCIQL